jgi:RNA recognition motif-containing protein
MKSTLENLRRLSILAFAVIAVFTSYILFAPTASATMSVGNLSQQVEEKDLVEVFSQYGPVKRVQLPRDRDTGKHRGSAFVELSSENEEQNAVDSLFGAELYGRIIKVNIAIPKALGGGTVGGGKNNSGGKR